MPVESNSTIVQTKNAMILNMGYTTVSPVFSLHTATAAIREPFSPMIYPFSPIIKERGTSINVITKATTIYVTLRGTALNVNTLFTQFDQGERRTT